MSTAPKAKSRAKKPTTKTKVSTRKANASRKAVHTGEPAPTLTDTNPIGMADQVVVDLSTSCSRDVAVAKLLGWMRGPIRRHYVEENEDGIGIDQMPFLFSLNGSLGAHLSAFRATAQRKLLEAFEDGADWQTADDLEKEITLCDQLIYKAAQYMRDIDAELVKGGLPHVRIHDLRHQYASFLVNAGRTLFEVQSILGHSSPVVTQRYSHLSTKSLAEAANSASIAIQKGMKSGT